MKIDWSGTHNMEPTNNNKNQTSTDNHGDLSQATIVREQIDIGLFAVGACDRALATPETEVGANMNEALREHIEGPAEGTGTVPVADPRIAPATKVTRKNNTRSKKCLLAGKEFFLAGDYASEHKGDPNLVLQGYVLECPNKKTNNGRFRIDWEHNTSLPPTVLPAMLRTWHPSTKEFREQLDSAIRKWEEEATVEEKNRVNKKRKQSSAKTATISAGMHAPPAMTRMFEARAGLRTEASTISSLSSRSLMTGTVLTDRRPPRPLSPSQCENVAESEDDRSVGTASARLSLIHI